MDEWNGMEQIEWKWNGNGQGMEFCNYMTDLSTSKAEEVGGISFAEFYVRCSILLYEIQSKNLNEAREPVLQSTGAKYSLLDRKLNLVLKEFCSGDQTNDYYQIDVDEKVPNQFTSLENKNLPAYLI